VFLSCLGVCLLLRMRWYAAVVWEIIGLTQVLLLNVARVSYMVLWAPRMEPGWADTFLHDTLSTFLLGAVILIQLEAGFWHAWIRKRQRLRIGIQRGELERPDKASIVPGAIRRLWRFAVIAVLVLGVVGGIAVGIYRGRASHRAEMVRGVVAGLLQSDPVSAQRAIDAALRLAPGDRDLRLSRARASLLLGDVQVGLDGLTVLANEAPLELPEQVLMAWALMRLGRAVEARALADGFPPRALEYPAVAMLRAEFAAADGRPEEVARHIVVAARSHLTLARVRALFPYLAQHEQWKAIVQADRDAPYTQPIHALIAVRAALRSDASAQAATALKRAMAAWPNDARFLPGVYALAQKWRGGEWEDVFADMLRGALNTLNADGLARYPQQAFHLRRPDLAWLLLNRLNAVAPDDPSLHMLPAQFCTDWFVVRKHRLGLTAEHPDERINLAPFVWQTLGVEPFAGLWKRVPRAAEIAALTGLRAFRDAEIERCLAELKRRDAAGTLTPRMDLLYPMALAMAGQRDAAHARLDEIERRHPDLRGQVLFQHAMLYDQQGDWARSYEALRAYAAADGVPNLTAELMLINALMHLNLGPCAIEAVRRSRRAFPGAVPLDLAESAIWDVFGFKEQALFVLDRTAVGRRTPAAVALLSETGRPVAAKRLAEALGVTLDPRALTPRNVRIAPAEWAVLPRWPKAPQPDERAALIAELKTGQGQLGSPFVEALRALQLRGHEQGASTDWQNLDAWLAPARDPLERLAAVHAFALLNLRYGRQAAARDALQKGLREAPESAILWRMLTGLTEGDSAVIADARAACPDDSELWLAELVTGVTTNATNTAAVAKLLEEAVAAADRYAPGDVVRGADYLLRRGRLGTATAMARAVIPRARGLLPAYVLGIRAAVAGRDLAWAMSCVINGIENAIDPTPFYRVLVAIKTAGGALDKDLLSALEFLKDRERNNVRWPEMLGQIYFAKGDMARALTILESVIDENTRGVRVQTLLLAAEAARLRDKPARAVGILEAAYALNPNHVSILNNLVYLLAQDKRTVERAETLLPKLLELAGDSYAVLDTAAMVCLRSGKLEQAKRYIDRATKAMPDKAYSAAEVRLNAAELQWRLGHREEARRQLDALRRDPKRTDFVDMRARRLIREIEAQGPSGVR
jgi:tetratricopeptide (TPR) repeat protein